MDPEQKQKLLEALYRLRDEIAVARLANEEHRVGQVEEDLALAARDLEQLHALIEGL